MTTTLKNTRKIVRYLLLLIKKVSNHTQHRPFYKLVDIFEEEETYCVVIKIMNKNITFNAKPEEILANDHLVDQFSPRDVRTLTYLGYLGINAPTYKILAKKLLKNEKIAFLIKKKGEKNVFVKTADQIFHETEMISSIHPKDASSIGYAFASEAIYNEKQQKEALISNDIEEKEKLFVNNNDEHRET